MATASSASARETLLFGQTLDEDRNHRFDEIIRHRTPPHGASLFILRLTPIVCVFILYFGSVLRFACLAGDHHVSDSRGATCNSEMVGIL